MPAKLVRLPKEKKLVQIGEAAEILGVSIDTIRRWDSAGRLNSSRPDGKNRYFSISELENLKFAAPLPISEAAKRLEVSVSTLRRLEKRGLLKPERTSGGARVYSKNTLENFLNSEYFLKEKEYQDNVLRPLKAVESTEVAEARPVQTEHKILGLVAEENSQKISKLFAFRNSFYFAGLTLATIFVLLVGIITLMFIMMPEETAKLLGYRTNTKTSQVLGVSYPQKDPTLMQDVLHPFSQVSLQIVKKVDPPAYAKVVQENKEQLVLSSDQLIMTDSGLVNNLNAEYVQGKVPGDEVGDLMVLGKNRTIDANVTTAATVTNGVYTTGSYLNPVWITGLTTSRFSSADISQWTNNSSYITGSSTNTLTNKSGDISMWTNNSGYITSSSTLAGLVRSTATGNSYFTGGNLGVGTSSPAFLFDVNGIVNATALYVDGSPYIGSQWTTSGNNIYYTTGNVGIGITSPSQVLDVTGNINISTGSTYKIAGTDVLSATTLGSAVVTSSLTTVGALASGSIASGFGNISTGNTITTSGTMGTAAITTFTGAGATFSGNVLFGGSTGILQSNGNVGVGTTEPGAKLDVAGSINLTGNIVSSGNTTIGPGDTGGYAVTLSGYDASLIVGASQVKARSAGTFVVEGEGGGDPHLTVQNGFNGYVKVASDARANTGSAHKIFQIIPGLDDAGTDDFTAFFMNVPTLTSWTSGIKNLVDIQYNSGTKFLIDYTGNVGIGTTAPSALLDVNGIARVTTLNATSALQLNGTSINTGGTLTNVAYLDTANIFTANQNFNLGFDTDDAFVVADGGALTTSQLATFNGNVLFGTSTGILSSGGNVGIGTTAPLSKLGVLGNLAIGATYGAFAAPASGLLVEGNVGVGTTSPLANLHVAGQCVTGDTLLKRRRRKKKRHSGGEGTEPIESDDEILSSLRSSRMTENDGLPRETEGEVWEDVRIDQIKPGDEILTLDEKSGKFVVSKVNALMDMGIQNVFELTTKDGHSIKTTAEHPYLVNTTKESSKNTNFFYHQTFESVLKTARAFYHEILEGQYIQVKALNREKIYFSHDGWDHIYTGHISKLEIMSRFFALDKIIPILKLAKTVTKEKSRTEKGTTFWALQGIIEGVWVKVIIRETKDKPKHFYSVIWKGEDHSKEVANAIKKGAVSRLYPRFQDCLGKAGLTFSTFNWKQYNTFVNDLQPVGVWKKVSALNIGDKIAVADSSDGGPQGLLRGGRVNWSEIASIKKVKREQVFDIEVEGTHNFVGNNIVAHNTILQGLGTTTGLNFRVQDSTGADKFTILDNGNVGIGTTSPGAKLNIVSTATTGADFTLTNTGIVTGNVASLVADALTSGTLMDFSADGLTTGKIMNLASTSTVLSTGGLLSLDWSPTGSTTIYATGDLLSVNIGQYGISGNLLNLKDNGSSVFSVSQSAVTTSLPANFTSPGDVSLAYDLNFTNPTASYIKSEAPLYLTSGESFNSSNLTLTTYHEGSIILASDNQPTTAATSYAVQLLPNLSSSTASLTYTGLYSLYNVPSINLTGTGTPTVTSVYGNYVGIGTTGTVANWYANYVAAPESTLTVTNKYAFVSESGAGNVGIGTTAPGYLFDVSGTARIGTLNGLIKGTTGVLSAAATGTDYIAGGVGAASQVAYFTGSGVLTGSNNFWFNGTNVGIGTTAPSALFSVGTTSQFQVNSSGAIAAAAGITNSGGYTQSGTTANTFTGTATFSNTAYSALFTGGNVGIGTTAPSAQLELSGSTAIKASGTAWDNPSDLRLKDVLGSYEKGLNEILQVNPVKYSFKEGNGLGLPQDGEHIGIIAQDIQGIFPEAVKTGASGYLTFQADPLIWASVNAIKELSSQLKNTPGVSPGSPGVDLTSLEERVKSLEEKISSHPELTTNHPDPETSSGLSGSTPSAETLNQVQGDNIATSSSVIASNSATASSWRESSTDRISDSIATPSASLQNDVIPNPSASLQNDIANLHVAGTAIFKGLVQVLEALTARTLTITEWADFLGQVIFKNDVTFEGRPVFNQDTAGFALINTGAQEVEVKFDKEYAESPLVNVSLTLDDNLTDQDKALLSPLELIDRQKAQEELESNVLNGDIKFIITRRTNNGFVIKLNKPATNDLKFSWTALAVKDAKVAVSDSVIATLSEQSESNGEAISTESGIATSSSTLPLSGTIARNDNVITPTPFPSPTPSPSVQTSPDVGFDSSGVSLNSVKTISINNNELGFLRVRDIPGAAGNELGQVLPGETYTVLESEMSSKGASQIWYQIEFDRGLIGWVSSAYVTLE